VDGYVTVDDDHLYRLVAELHDSEGIDIEPSSTAGLVGIGRVLLDGEYLARQGLDDTRLSRATHIAWATGGSMVPRAEMEAYVEKGHRLLAARD